MQRLRRLSHAIYGLTAANYESAIGPVMLPLARDLVMQTPLPAAGILLDIGTGTGFVLRQIAGPGRRSIGIDRAYPMLRGAAARQRCDGWPGAVLLQADAHNLRVFPAGTFDAILSSFGLGECDPEPALRAAGRALRPGGVLALQEWGPYPPDDPRAIVDDTLADFALPQADGLRADLRALLATPLPWQEQLQDPDDYRAALEHAGLTALDCREFRPVTLRLSVASFLAYCLAWAPRALEVAALPPATRAAFEQAVTARLRAQADAADQLSFSPVVFRALAARRQPDGPPQANPQSPRS